MFRWTQITADESEQYEGYEKEKVIPVACYRYKGLNPNDNSNDAIDMVNYHVYTLPKFQDIVDKSGAKGKFGGWLSIRMNMGER